MTIQDRSQNTATREGAVPLSYGSPKLRLDAMSAEPAPRSLNRTRIFTKELGVSLPIDAGRIVLCPSALDGCTEDPHEYIATDVIDVDERADVVGALIEAGSHASSLLDDLDRARAEPFDARVQGNTLDIAASAQRLISQALAHYLHATCLCPGRLASGETRVFVGDARLTDGPVKLRELIDAENEARASVRSAVPGAGLLVGGVLFPVTAGSALPDLTTALADDRGPNERVRLQAELLVPEELLLLLASWRLFSLDSAATLGDYPPAGARAPLDLRHMSLDAALGTTIIGGLDVPHRRFRIGPEFEPVTIGSDLAALRVQPAHPLDAAIAAAGAGVDPAPAQQAAGAV